MATVKDCHTMTDYYCTVYKIKYKIVPNINRHKARWGWDSVLQDMSVSEAKNLIEYYLQTNSSHGHSIEWFFNNYDKLIEKRADYEADEAKRKALRAETKKKYEEWKARQNGDV